MVKKDSLAINALPVILLMVLLAVFSIQKLIYLVVLMAPLSLPLRELSQGLSFDMFLPTEPLLFGILIIFLLKVLADRGFDRRIMTHPVTVAVFINLGWIFLASFASSMPVVSFKFFLSRLWFIVGLYLLVIKIFEKEKNYEFFVWLYVISFVGVIFYATIRHLGYGLWDKDASHFVVKPFYNDHTSYGAMLAMYIPLMMGFSFSPAFGKKFRIAAQIALAILFMGLILSYARAAWLSIFAGLMVWLVIKLKIRFSVLFITIASLIAFFVVFQSQILMALERNSEESSANIAEHISSMSNISSDASNLERINRWSCAIRMFEEHPFWGYGPGTYMFKYAPYQLTKDRTIISTNAGDGGNAHSEYLGPLAEEGVLGLLTFLILIGTVIYTAIKVYSRITDKRLKTLVLGSLIGLVTYYIHGLMNNFLDTDKASVPFWGFTAIIVAIDLATRAKEKTATPLPE